MRLKKHPLLICCGCLAVITVGLCVGCASQKTEISDAEHLETLHRFVEEETFEPLPGSFYPEEQIVQDELLAYVTRKYDSDCDVRRLMAYYFLRYDSALLDHGLISVGGGPGTLIGFLWEKEPNGGRETPSAGMMRDHIADSPQRFCLGLLEKEQLASNQAKFAKLVEWWKTGVPQSPGQRPIRKGVDSESDGEY